MRGASAESRELFALLSWGDDWIQCSEAVPEQGSMGSPTTPLYYPPEVPPTIKGYLGIVKPN